MAAPFPRKNVDTDLIIRIERCTGMPKEELGKYAFEMVRYLPGGAENPEFVLNQPRYRGAQILLARDNFGCGSSREHAPWAIVDYGFRAVIAPSFADIFYGNSAKNGLLLVTLSAEIVEQLFSACRSVEGYRLTIDLAAQTVTTPAGEAFGFDYNAGLKHRMLNGLDDIGITLQHAEKIRAYESRKRAEAPWLFAET